LRIVLISAVIPLLHAQALVAQTTFTLPDTLRLSPVERELLRFEQDRSAAIARHDTAQLRRMYAPEFTGVTATGFEVTVERLLGVFAQDDPTTVFAIDEIRVRQLSAVDAAVLSGRLTTRRRTGELVAQSRFLHVYERRGGRWIIVAAQGTLLPQRSG
jgi:hypothetical protein